MSWMLFIFLWEKGCFGMGRTKTSTYNHASTPPPTRRRRRAPRPHPDGRAAQKKTHVVIPGPTARPAISNTSLATRPALLIFSISSALFASMTHGNRAGRAFGTPSRA